MKFKNKDMKNRFPKEVAHFFHPEKSMSKVYVGTHQKEKYHGSQAVRFIPTRSKTEMAKKEV